MANTAPETASVCKHGVDICDDCLDCNRYPPDCTCSLRSWYGEGHDSECPLSDWEPTPDGGDAEASAKVTATERQAVVGALIYLSDSLESIVESLDGDGMEWDTEKQEIADARALIERLKAAPPEPDWRAERNGLLTALRALLEWEGHMGGFDAPCWDEARGMSVRLHEDGTASTPQRILIVVEGGQILSVDHIPPGVVVEVRDFDTEGADESAHNIRRSEESGDLYRLSEWGT